MFFKLENGVSEKLMFSYVCLFAGHIMMHFDVSGFVLMERGNKRE